MVDLDPIPLADVDDKAGTSPAPPSSSPTVLPWRPPPQRTPGTRSPFLAITLIAVISLTHGLAIWQGMGGRDGLTNGWPLCATTMLCTITAALVTRAFLRQSGTTAGYDPFFMAGYPKSVVFPASSTLPELVVWAFGGSQPDLAYKVYVLVSAAILPWVIALAAGAFGSFGPGQRLLP